MAYSPKILFLEPPPVPKEVEEILTAIYDKFEKDILTSLAVSGFCSHKVTVSENEVQISKIQNLYEG